MGYRGSALKWLYSHVKGKWCIPTTENLHFGQHHKIKWGHERKDLGPILICNVSTVVQ